MYYRVNDSKCDIHPSFKQCSCSGNPTPRCQNGLFFKKTCIGNNFNKYECFDETYDETSCGSKESYHDGNMRYRCKNNLMSSSNMSLLIVLMLAYVIFKLNQK